MPTQIREDTCEYLWELKWLDAAADLNDLRGSAREPMPVYSTEPPTCDAAWQRANAAALKLDVTARARLAGSLLLSLDAPSDEENLHLWVAETERRLSDLRAGCAKELPMSEALDRARAALA